MCLYLGVAENMVDVVAYCVCRVLELSMLTFMMMCNTAKSKLAQVQHSANNELTLDEE